MARTVRLHSLPLMMRLAGKPVILLGEGPAADAKRRLLERAGAGIVDESGAARLAIVAIEDSAEAESAVARLRARGVLVNAVDRLALCDFTLPAIIDRDPVLIAIGTGGASAGLAAALRQRFEAMLPAGVGRLADALHAQDAEYHAFSGSVTVVHTEGFGDMASDGADAQIELRASWTPGGGVTAHVTAWSDLLCTLAGLPPAAPGVIQLPRRRSRGN